VLSAKLKNSEIASFRVDPFIRLERRTNGGNEACYRQLRTQIEYFGNTHIRARRSLSKTATHGMLMSPTFSRDGHFEQLQQQQPGNVRIALSAFGHIRVFLSILDTNTMVEITLARRIGVRKGAVMIKNF